MSDPIKLTIVCHECKHRNKFNVMGEIIQTVGGGGFPVINPEDDKKVRICEECGCELIT